MTLEKMMEHVKEILPVLPSPLYYDIKHHDMENMKLRNRYNQIISVYQVAGNHSVSLFHIHFPEDVSFPALLNTGEDNFLDIEYQTLEDLDKQIANYVKLEDVQDTIKWMLQGIQEGRIKLT